MGSKRARLVSDRLNETRAVVIKSRNGFRSDFIIRRRPLIADGTVGYAARRKNTYGATTAFGNRDAAIRESVETRVNRRSKTSAVVF